MAKQDYTVAAVSSQQAPRTWKTKKGDEYTSYKVRLKEVGEEIVELSIESEKQPPQKDDIYNGEIEATEYGKKLMIWKPRPQFSGGGGGRSFQPKDDREIRAQAIIKEVIKLNLSEDEAAKKALYYFQLVDHLKANVDPFPSAAIKKVADGIEDKLPDDDFAEKPVDLSEIPF